MSCRARSGPSCPSAGGFEATSPQPRAIDLTETDLEELLAVRAEMGRKPRALAGEPSVEAPQ